MEEDNFIETKERSVTPERVLVGYKTTNDGYSSSYFTYHKVVNGEIKAGTPLTKRTLSHMVRLIDPKKIDQSCQIEWGGWLDHRILFMNWSETSKALMWLEEPKIVEMNFKDSLGLPSGKPMGVPPTIFYIKNGALRVYSLQYTQDITLKSKLYDAPYFNTSGSVCIGTGFKGINFSNRNDVVQTINNYSRMFWTSQFSEVHGNSYSKTIIPMYKKLIGKKKPFPVNLLNELNINIQDALNR